MNVAEVKALADEVRAEIGKAIVGQPDTIDLLLTALFARGHVLLEGPPGMAKTFLAQCFARTLGLDFGRIQFTPDLMPADIIGSNVFNFQTSTFTLTEGPLFCELLLADEINRTPPKTQAALLEAMQERQRHDRRQGARRSATASWWWRPRTRWSSRAPIRCPRPSSTGSCSSRCWPIRAARRSAGSSPSTACRAATPTRPSAASSGWPTRQAAGRRAQGAWPACG